MLDDAPRPSPRVPRRLVWVAVALIALPAAVGALTILLLTTSSASHSAGSRPLPAPSVSSQSGSATCSRTNRDQVHSTRTGAEVTVVPPGATGVLLCRYGPNGRRVRMRSITSRSTTHQLGWELNALPRETGARSCPLDDGETITADFIYARAAPNPVSVGLSGCQVVTNGHVHRLGLNHPVIGLLPQLVPWAGTIKGRLEICGGPAPGACRSTTSYRVCAGSRCATADQVAILHRTGRQYANAQLKHGRFTVYLEPGRYRLALLGDGRLAHARVLDEVRVNVRLNRTTPIVFRLQAR